MAKVTLVNMNRISVPPIGPYAIDILGSALNNAGHDVEVLDLTPKENSLKAIDDYFEDSKPNLVGLCLRNTNDVYFPSYFDLDNRGSFLPEHGKIINRIKEHIPIEKIIIGGVGFSSDPSRLLNRFGLKYGVMGPGESTIVQIANIFDSGHSLKFYNNNGGVFVFDGRKSRIKSRVHRVFFDNKWYYDKGGLGNIRTTNGCPMGCSYCIESSAIGNKLKKRNIKDIIFEIDQLVEMGINDIHTADSEFNLCLPYAKDVLKAVVAQHYDLDVKFWLYCQPKPFDEEFAFLLSKANVEGINFGIDHTDKDLLETMGKWYTKEDIQKTTELCKEYGVAVKHEFLFGYPGDTPDKMYKAIDFVKNLDPLVIGIALGLGILPGTQLAEMFEKKLSSHDPMKGFYFNGEPYVDPVYYIDPSFKIPEIFTELKEYVGIDENLIMFPQLKSTSNENNQLVGSDFVRGCMEKHKKGAFWYHYNSTKERVYAN